MPPDPLFRVSGNTDAMNPHSGTMAEACPVASDDAPDWTGFQGPQALAALHALGQQTRLTIFRLLVRREPYGIAAGVIAEEIRAPQNTVSSHLAVLARAKLVHGVRAGRSVIYRAHLAGLQSLIGYLLADCCSDHPEVHTRIFAVLDQTRCCAAPLFITSGVSGAGRMSRKPGETIS